MKTGQGHWPVRQLLGYYQLGSNWKGCLVPWTNICKKNIKTVMVGLENVFDTFILGRGTIIVFVWSQYDSGNIEQRTIGYGCRQN